MAENRLIEGQLDRTVSREIIFHFIVNHPTLLLPKGFVLFAVPELYIEGGPEILSKERPLSPQHNNTIKFG